MGVRFLFLARHIESSRTQYRYMEAILSLIGRCKAQHFSFQTLAIDSAHGLMDVLEQNNVIEQGGVGVILQSSALDAASGNNVGLNNSALLGCSGVYFRPPPSSASDGVCRAIRDRILYLPDEATLLLSSAPTPVLSSLKGSGHPAITRAPILVPCCGTNRLFLPAYTWRVR